MILSKDRGDWSVTNGAWRPRRQAVICEFIILLTQVIASNFRIIGSRIRILQSDFADFLGLWKIRLMKWQFSGLTEMGVRPVQMFVFLVIFLYIFGRPKRHFDLLATRCKREGTYFMNMSLLASFSNKTGGNDQWLFDIQKSDTFYSSSSLPGSKKTTIFLPLLPKVSLLLISPKNRLD